MSEQAADRAPWWRHLLDRIEGREVVVVRGLIVLVVSVGLVWGVDLTDVGDRLEDTLDALGVFVQLLGLAWVRSGVTPAREVVEARRADGAIVAGEGSPLPTGMVLEQPHGRVFE